MRMGPGYFPTVLGGLLALIGFILVVRALLQPGPSVGRLAYGKLVLVTLSNVVFALLLRRLGLAGALILLVIVSAYANKRFRWPEWRSDSARLSTSPSWSWASSPPWSLPAVPCSRQSA